MATDWQTGIDPADRAPEDFPYDQTTVARQTEGVYRRLRALFEPVGSSVPNMVRVDQFVTVHNQFRHYLPVRDQYLTKDRPASTAVAIKDLLVTGAMIQVDSIAIVPSAGFVNVGIDNEKAPKPRAGYSLAIRAGDWIWCSGASPTDFVSRAPYPGGPGHTQPEDVFVDPNFWYGSEIKNQARYDLHKLQLYLEAAGSDLSHAVKAQVYLTDPRDLPGLMDVWQETFGDNPPATTVVPIDQMGIGGSRCEINLIALAGDSAIRREVIQTTAAPQPHFHAPQAIKAGPFLFLSGRMAVNETGIDPRAREHAASAYLHSPGRGEMETILDHAGAVLTAAGGSIQDLVRVQLFSTDLREIGPALGPWSNTFDEDGPALTVVGVTGPHIVPKLNLAADLMAYLPED